MKYWFFAGLVALTGLLAGPVHAQAQFLIFQNPLVLVENKDVQKDLKLSDEQVMKITDLGRTYADGIRGLGFQDIDKRKKFVEAAQKGLGEILAGEQAKRVKQLELQQRGANVFLDPQVAKDLAITPAQQAVVLKLMQTVGPKTMAAIQAAKGDRQQFQKILADVNRSLTADIVKGLTPNQQARWGEISGPAFAGNLPTAMVPIGILPNPRPQPVLAWHMNDLAAAQAEAKKTGKPIFVTFRCEA